MVLLIVCLYSPIKWRLYRPLCYMLCIIINYSITLHCQPSQHKTICLDQNANYGLLMFICPQFYVSIPDEDEEDFAYLPWPCCLLRQRRISAPDSVSSPAQPSPCLAQPSPAPALPCHYFYFLCGGNWPRRVSCRDHWSCAEQCKFPHSICKIHCTFAKTIQVLSAYQYHELHCLKNIFIFVFRYFCRQETLRHVNCSGNNIT